MQKILLVSMFQNVAGMLEKVEPNLKNKRITYIPTASIVENTDSFPEMEKQELKKLGLIVDELEISASSYETIQSTLKKNDFIFISGGNTFFLLQELKRTGTDQLLKEEVNSGKLYIGESAGAIVASPDIGYSAEMDQPEKAPDLKENMGLGLVDFYTVPHDKNPEMGEAAKKIVAMYSESLNLKVIHDYQAILVQDGEIRILESV